MTQIKVTDSGIVIWNPGLLPDELNIEMLFKQHSSLPRNRSLADLFFKAGYIESWGRGTNVIVKECLAYELPSPRYYEQNGGFIVEFFNKPVTPQVTPQVAQLIAILTGEMSREELQTAIGIKDREHFRIYYLKPALTIGVIERTIPEKPNSKNQKYRLKK